MDEIALIIRAKRALLNLFPFVSSYILYIPTKFANCRASFIFTQNGFRISRRLLSLSRELLEPTLLFVLFSGCLVYSFALNKRIRGFNKTIYYIASALYANELTYRIFGSKGYLLNKSMLVNNGIHEFYETFEDLIREEIPDSESLLKKSVDEIYRILLRKFEAYRGIIENIIILYYKYGSESKNIIKELERELLDKLSIKVGIEKAERIVNSIISAVERYVHEYKIEKYNPELIKKVTEGLLSIFGSERGVSSTVLIKKFESFVISDKAKKVLYLFHQLSTQLSSIIRRYNYYKYGRKRILYRALLRKDIVVPRFERDIKYEVIFAIDVSGSISDDVYITFAGMVEYIIKNIRNISGKVITFSGDVTGELSFDEFSKDKLIEFLKTRRGYGGTIFNSVLRRVDRPENKILIVLTDGKFADKELDTSKLSKFYKIIFISTEEVPEEIKKLRNVVIYRV